MSVSALSGSAPEPPRRDRSRYGDLGAADAALAALSAELRQRLAALDNAPDDAVEAAIGLMPYGHRALLESYELIETIHPAAAASTEGASPRRAHLTDLGRTVADLCARPESSDGEAANLAARAEALHRQYADRLPFEAAEAES